MKSAYIVLDFETTGLSPQVDRVIEIGAVKVMSGEITDRYQTLINPRFRIPSVITQITGITNQMVATAPDARSAINELKQFVGELPILAHNASFDSRFFFAEMQRLGHHVQNEFFCSLLLARRILPELKGHKLQDLCGHYQIHNTEAHRALADVLATQQVFTRICGQIKEQGRMSDITLPVLQKVCKTPKAKVPELLRSNVLSQNL